MLLFSFQAIDNKWLRGWNQLFDKLFLGLAGVTVNIVHRHVRRRVPEHTLDFARMHPTIGQPRGQSVAHRMKSEPSHWLSVVVANTIPQLKNISGDRGRMNVVSNHDTSRARLSSTQLDRGEDEVGVGVVYRLCSPRLPQSGQTVHHRNGPPP